MSRIGAITFDPKDPVATSDSLTRMQRVVDSRIEFGNPLDPRTQGSVVKAGTGHNGTLMNILGSWVEIAVEATNTAFDVIHNLAIPVFNSEPNVCWIVMRMRHDGNTVNAASTLSVNFQTGDTITTNKIQLRLYAGGTRVVSAAHPVGLSLFVVPANRMP